MIQCSIYTHDTKIYLGALLVRDNNYPPTTCTYAPISHAPVYTCTNVVCSAHVRTGIPVVPNTSFNPYMYLVY